MKLEDHVCVLRKSSRTEEEQCAHILYWSCVTNVSVILDFVLMSRQVGIVKTFVPSLCV